MNTPSDDEIERLKEKYSVETQYTTVLEMMDKLLIHLNGIDNLEIQEYFSVLYSFTAMSLSIASYPSDIGDEYRVGNYSNFFTAIISALTTMLTGDLKFRNDELVVFLAHLLRLTVMSVKEPDKFSDLLFKVDYLMERSLDILDEKLGEDGHSRGDLYAQELFGKIAQ